MKKILVIQDSLRGGGAERVLINILNKIDYNKYSVDLVLLYEDGVYLESLPKEVNIKRIYPKINTELKLVNKVNNFIKRKYINSFTTRKYKKLIGNDYDIEIAFLEGPSTRILSKSSNKSSKKIGWVHNDLSLYRTMNESEESNCYSQMDNIICVSKDSKSAFIKLYPQYEEKVDVIYNLINTDEIIYLSNEEIDYKFNLPTVIGVGRLAEQKRFDILINAHKKLLDEGLEHKLLILGEGHRRDELLRLANELGVSNSVDIQPFKKNPYPYIKQSDVFAMSSDFEGLPLVITEAIVLGKAIVSTKCTGPVELLGNGEYGVLVERQNIDELKEGLRLLLTSEEDRLYYESKSLERSKIFNQNEVMNSIYKILES